VHRSAPSLSWPKRGPRSSAKTWAQCPELCNGNRNQALVLAYREGGLTMTALAAILGLSVSHISRLIAAGEVAWEGRGCLP
jgi:hypothetical protein